MRQEIVDAIAKWRSGNEFFARIRSSLPDPMNLNSYSGSLVSPEGEEGLKKFYEYQLSFKACLVQSPYVQAVHVLHVSLSVRWNDDLKEEVVIELSQWGPLASVYIYGRHPPGQVLEAIDSCLDRLGLIKLSEQEIDELYEQGVYIHIF